MKQNKRHLGNAVQAMLVRKTMGVLGLLNRRISRSQKQKIVQISQKAFFGLTYYVQRDKILS